MLSNSCIHGAPFTAIVHLEPILTPMAVSLLTTGYPYNSSNQFLHGFPFIATVH